MVNTLIKSILLLILIILIMIGGLLIFDWLGLLSLRDDFGPVLRLVGLNTPTNDDDEEGLNDTRLRQQLESLNLRRENLDELEDELLSLSGELQERELQVAQAEDQLQEQLDSLEQLKNSYRDRDQKVEKLARNFTGMPPAQAVAQMSAMDALLVVDVLRVADRIAEEENTASLVPYWLSQMAPERGAEINELLIEKP